MARVADTPDVAPLPGTAPGPGYTTPKIYAEDYSGAPLKFQAGVSAIGRAKEEARRADVKLKLQEAGDLYYMKARELLLSEGGLLQRQGRQVLDRVNGKTFQEQGYETLHTLATDLGHEFNFSAEEMNSFSSSILKYDKVFYPAIVEHEANEKRLYAVSVQDNNIAVQSYRVSEGANIGQAYQASYAAQMEKARLLGKDQNPKLVESAAKASVSEGAKQYVANCILQGEPEKAQLWLEANWQHADKYLTADGLLTMRDSVKTALQAKQDNIAANSVAMTVAQERTAAGALSSVLDADPAYRLAIDGLMKKSAEEKGAQGWEANEQSRRSYAVSGMDDFIVQMGGVETASAVLAVAKTSGGTLDQAKATVQAAVDAAGKAGDPTKFAKFLKPEATQAYGDVMKRYQARLNHVPTYADYLAMTQKLAPHAAPEDIARQAAVAKQRGDAVQVLRDGQDLATMQQVTEQYLQGDFDTSKIPQLAQLSPQTKLALARLRGKIANGTYAVDTDAVLVSQLMDNPDILANLTDLQIEQMRYRLGEQGYEEIRRRRRELASGGVPGEVNMGTVNAVLKDLAPELLGIPGDKINGTDAKTALFYWQRELRPVLQQQLTQTGGKAGWTHAEYENRIRDYLTHHIGAKGWFTDTDKIFATIQPGDVPSSLTEPLAKAFALDPAVVDGDGELRLSLVRRALVMPNFTFGPYITDKDRAMIRDQWRAKTGTDETPDDGLTARIYILNALGDTPALRNLYSRGRSPLVLRGAGAVPQAVRDAVSNYQVGYAGVDGYDDGRFDYSK